MIGWKANYGYYTGSNPTNISDVTWSDIDRNFCIVTDINPTTDIKIDINNDLPEAHKQIQNALGEEYEYIFGVVRGIYYAYSEINISNLDLMNSILVNTFSQCPNLISYITSLPAGTDIQPIVYLKSLNRVILLGGQLITIGVVSDNSISYPFGSHSGSLFTLYQLSTNTISFLRFSNYEPSAPLNTQHLNNISVEAALYDTTKNRVHFRMWAGVDSRFDFITLELFTNDSKPDFSGTIGPNNPYDPGGSSEEGGGNGSFDDESDIITIPSLPTISSSDTGFTRIYNPTLAQVQELARYLWTEESVIETIWNHIKQYFENPMEAIIGFNLVPVPVPNGGTTTFKLMYIDTGVSMTAAANQFVDVDCGTLELKEYYGSALDYSPFTKISCFLPYIGNVSLNVDEVMGRTLGVKYRVDICSGACVAYITVDGNAIYQYSGHCAIPIPISAADFSNYVTATISTAKLAAAGITAGAGVAAGMMTEDPSPQTNQIVKVTKQVQTARNPATGRQITTGTTTTTVEKPTEQDNTNASFAGLAPQNIANTVGTIMGSKPHIEHSGSFSGNSGYLGVRRPFVIIQRPNMCMPSNYQQLNGFPSMITMPLSDCTGFTRVQQVQLTGFQATNPEQAEIMQLLKTGVIL